MRRKDRRTIYDDPENDGLERFIFEVSSPDEDGDVEVQLDNQQPVWLTSDQAIELHTALGDALGIA